MGISGQSHASASLRLPLGLLGLPLGALLVVVLAAASIGLLFGSAAACTSSATPLKGVPSRLVPIYAQASSRYGLGARGPAILAAINEVETGFGANLGPSSAGAEGWMQFLPSTWSAYGVDADGDGDRDPADPWDAIFAAARYLRASGAPGDWRAAIFAYNHADWYVAKVLRAAERLGNAHDLAASSLRTGCGAGGHAVAALRRSVRLYAPRGFKAIPARLWVGGGAPQAVDVRVWPGAVWLLESYDLRVTAAREPGHRTHGDGTAIDLIPAAGRGWDQTALRAARALGWTDSCGSNGSAPACPLVSAIQFVAYNGYPGHGDPAHAGSNAHLHISWRSSDYGCPGLCEPREWVEVFLWPG